MLADLAYIFSKKDTRLEFMARLVIFNLLTLLLFPVLCLSKDTSDLPFNNDLLTLSSLKDRSTGTDGVKKAADYIIGAFKQIGHEDVKSHYFSQPVRLHEKSELLLVDKGISYPILPIRLNAISPGTISHKGIEGPLIYVGNGNLEDFNGENISGSIILMDLDSGKNWLNAASLGAKALIYLDKGATPKSVFEEKKELTPIRFPRFWIPISEFYNFIGIHGHIPKGKLITRAKLTSKVTWQEVIGENIYCLIPGSDPELQEELILIEAFYDSTAIVYGRSPGADEACSIATLLDIARFLRINPPAKSVLLVASSGHAQTLAGMRELFWSISTRSKEMRQMEDDLESLIENLKNIEDLKNPSLDSSMDEASEKILMKAIKQRIKVEEDIISRQLMQLRLEAEDQEDRDVIDRLAEKRMALRSLGWRTDLSDLTAQETKLLKSILPQSIKDQKEILEDAEKALKLLKSSKEFRSLIKSFELTASISLHLSSHGQGFGAFNQGWLYSLKPSINRTSEYSTLDRVLQDAASWYEKSFKKPSLLLDTLRPSRMRTWESYFFDRPALGGEISALAGFLGVSFVTVNDARASWGTPYDSYDKIDMDYAIQQSDSICNILSYLINEPIIHYGEMPANGLSDVLGRANFIRHGELFPDQPAPGSIILAYQGNGVYHTRVNNFGIFHIKGVADKKHVPDKVILEGYRFDPDDGSVIWAIDKKQTGINAYRVKMQRRNMETDLVMFACKESTLFNLLEPRNFHYMTRPELLDSRSEAIPLRYWWSRIDTRKSTIASIYLEPGTPYKMILSDSFITKDMILLNADNNNPQGDGYRIDDWPFIYNTEFRVANDMWSLVGPRINNLESHGIYNDRIRKLYNEGISALNQARSGYDKKQYDIFKESASRSWALANRVYDHVEKTQKDVLFGVLFYIALFVPFAFCLERLLFCFSNINKRLIAFLLILIILIAVIYKVHPAFQLAYSPMVVILAFFILGLSFIVSLIIFLRFEEEMNKLQSRATTIESTELGRWKAFVAAFLLGVSNLRRRRIRTTLTCLTLIILTFTIMSFTSVKSMRHHARVLFSQESAYKGFLIKDINQWGTFPLESLSTIYNSFSKDAIVAPRVWFEQEDRTRPTIIPIRYNNRTYEAQGLIGLSSQEGQVTNMTKILTKGRWFNEKDQYSVIISRRTADHLGINFQINNDIIIHLWGIPYKVIGIFSGEFLQESNDLDGEPLTPVVFNSEASLDMTEVEIEAEESGEDIKSFETRYQHVPGELTLIVPYKTLLSSGGSLKGFAVRLGTDVETQSMAKNLVDRFGLSLFSGEPDGTYLYHASDTMSYSGVPNIIIPLMISVFIVLNTMIGSVYERKREIAVYTSVGLAPSHVSFLFIAESMAFAVLSVVLGYLLAQTTSFLFSGTALWGGITVNYSSLSGVGAMLLVILVVLISVIYPSKVAGEIAIPDVNRSWKLPDAKGNLLELALPFLMKYSEQKSIGGYIFEYFKIHQDVTHGIFSTGDVQISYICPRIPSSDKSSTCKKSQCNRPECLRLVSRVWLAPFDLGITQNVEIQFCSSEEEKDFLIIKVRIIREAGESETWRRINKGFLNLLRKQLLMWRSLNLKSQEYYEDRLVDI